jgi:hypothetical protein
MQIPQLLLGSNLILCAILTGLIWTIQVVHYPSFLGVGSEYFASWHQKHMSSITFLVGPLMLLEAGAALVILNYYSNFSPSWLLLISSGLVLFVFLNTFFFAVPLHDQLVKYGYNEKVIHRLIQTNWCRTIAWTLRLGVLIYLYVKSL